MERVLDLTGSTVVRPEILCPLADRLPAVLAFLLGLGTGGGGYVHSVCRNRHEVHVGRASSHLTFRALQVVQPPRDFLWDILRGYVMMLTTTPSLADGTGP